MGTLTATAMELEHIQKKAVNCGKAFGYEMRRGAAIKRLGKYAYKVAVEKRDLIERKLDPTKKNSPTVVERDLVIYVEQITSKL